VIVTVSSVRGAPGVTSWCLLLAAAWSADLTDERVVLEADCDGAVLAARHGCGVDPGAVSLIASSKRDSPTRLAVEEHGRRVADRLWVIPGPETAETARPVWASGCSTLAPLLAADPRIWLVDAGRLGPGSPLDPLRAVAAAQVVVCRAGIEDLVQLPARVRTLRDGGRSRVGVLVIGRPAYRAEELSEFTAADRVWLAPEVHDLPRLAATAVQGGRARRSALWRCALDVAADLAALTVSPPDRDQEPERAQVEAGRVG
jgi:MinD-like ATPase involved in chromosome partitioning or flagellar assembly